MSNFYNNPVPTVTGADSAEIFQQSLFFFLFRQVCKLFTPWIV